MQVYVPIWTFTEGSHVESRSLGVFRDVESAFLALIKTAIEDEYILHEIHASNNIRCVTFQEALASLGGGFGLSDSDVEAERKRIFNKNKALQMEIIRPFTDTTEKFATHLYKNYISREKTLTKMSDGMRRLCDECGTKQFVEDFTFNICVHTF